MKVRIEFTLDINPDDWTREFGVEGTAQVRADVQERARHIVIQQFNIDGIAV